MSKKYVSLARDRGNGPGAGGGSFHLGTKKMPPFWLGTFHNDPERMQEVINVALKYEDMTKTCRLCGKVALYRVRMVGYCKEHFAEAQESARRRAKR